MPNKSQRIRRSQLACPHCGKHKISVRDTVAKGSRIIERYRFCEACQRLSKTREQFVSDYQEYPKKLSVAGGQLSESSYRTLKTN